MDENNEIHIRNNPKYGSLPILRSTSKETKNRFDNLLKHALNHKNDTRKTSASPNKLINKNLFETHDDESNSSTIQEYEFTVSKKTAAEKIKNTETTLDASKENYIMEKFLSDAASIKQEDKALTLDLPSTNTVSHNKPPLPLPRTIKTKLNTDESSSASNRTYSISSAKITNTELLKDIDRLSISTASTYNIMRSSKETLLPQTLNDVDTYVNENKHYISTVGDIIVHSTDGAIVPGSKVNIVEQKLLQRNSTKIDVSKLQPSEIQYIIDSKYKQIEERRISSESCVLKEDTLMNIEEDFTTMDLDTMDTISTSKLMNRASSRQEIKPYTYENVIGVVIYRCDKLLVNNYVTQPCVKVHIVDSVTGKYIRRSYNSEQQPTDLTCGYMYPLITKAYNMQEKRSLVPYWEEILIFEEDFGYMMNYEHPVIIFFEILDFLSFADANVRYSVDGSFSGWHKIAWAFLKPIGKGYLNTEQKLRLQLYKPKKSTLLKTSKECGLHDWWKSGDLVKYPSTIHVCVKHIKNTKQENPLNINEIYKTKINTHEPDFDLEKDSDYSEKKRPKCKIKWTKKSTQSCKIPTKIISEYKTSEKGCFLVKFSNDGYLLAAGLATATKYPICIYSISETNMYCKFEGHQGLIYDFNWSPNDNYLISAASDCTVCIWNVTTKEYYPVQTLPHPSFVYCALLKILEETEIITGCYDKILRVWKADNKVNISTNYELRQEIEGHVGYITSICSRKYENILYSSDSLGVVIEWIFTCEKWMIAREFKFKEYLNTIINRIILHPKSDKLFAFCRDSTIRLIDLKANCILQWFKGALNDRLLLTGCVTPCGSSIFSASEDGTICIWNSNTGILRGTYNPYMNKYKILTIPYCIDYHPFDHIVTFCHYGSAIPIILCIYHRSFIDMDLQFKNLEEPLIDKCPKRIKKKKAPEALKTNTCINIGGIIDKIDDVLLSAKTL